MSLHVAILHGGISHERDVSLRGGRAVADGLQAHGYATTLIDVGADIAAMIQEIRACTPDVVFNNLHGPLGEDGAIQGVLEWLDLPYTHCDIRTSSLAMNKVASRQIFAAAGIPIAPGKLLTPAELAAAHPFETPYVVKPVAEGSSFGVHVIKGDDAATQRRDIASGWAYGDILLAEAFIPGRELTVSVLGERPLTVTDIVAESAQDGFYNYHAKYAAGGSRHSLPADIPGRIFEDALRYAREAHAALGCRGATRADFRYDESRSESGLVILEVNTQPGMTPTSLLPEQAAHCGMDFSQLCDWIVQEAWGRRKVRG
ncbi:D-alanine--D-alanine ligase [Candidatus Kirkpatrickella diaphorinae]|uniref:D-alanine--D-alanine ligase n=1 Tax=Candidatus Kirkpatrickella diaphorinae TaxID=2984322 RepID=A0ABY6GJG9_9PROT|nr:D-alanine--D-alanine ligase [Candidatus Kirkpatrickella diaphorinae]UYH51677.1 D-alanine--D-alanine ligase [Candidatus Kirkpatrickella diaphorinae]